MNVFIANRFCVAGVVAAIVMATGCSQASFSSSDDAKSANAGPDLDISAYEITFEDEFDDLDVSGRRCDSRWIAHTPWNGDFGAAQFVDPSRGFPFVTKDGVLRIEARKEAGHGWFAGLLSSWNTCGEGFAQQYGYFEIRTQLPDGPGFWPAFWLIGVDREEFAAEIDIFEYHTIRPRNLEVTVHVHALERGARQYKDYHLERVEPGSLSKGFNTYGVDVQEDEMIFYLNRKEIWRSPTLPEFQQPLYILFNLAMDGGEITDNTPESAYMYVDYVRAYARR